MLVIGGRCAGAPLATWLARGGASVVVEADADTFLELSAGAIAPAQAIKRGARIEGSPAALARMGSIVPPRTPEHELAEGVAA